MKITPIPNVVENYDNTDEDPDSTASFPPLSMVIKMIALLLIANLIILTAFAQPQ